MFAEIALIIAIPALLTVGATILAGRAKTAMSGEVDSDSVSFVGGVLNALFTVVLAFFVVFAWQTGDDIDTAMTQETNALIDIYWQTAVVPEPDATAIRAKLANYATRVTEHEWAALDRGETDPEVPRVLASLREKLTALPTDAESVKGARERALQDTREVDENHRERVAQATGDDIFTSTLLLATILGAVIMVLYPLLIGLSSRPRNVAVMVLLTLILGGTVFVSLELMHPLSGWFGTQPDAFRHVLEQLSTIP